jgi:hypothetical protein
MTDTDARELALFAENDGDLYRSRILPIVANLARKVAGGTYDADKALTLWRYAADDAAQRYTREHGTPGPNGSFGCFDTATRQAVAVMLAEGYAEHMAEEAQTLRLRKQWTVATIKAAHESAGGVFFDRSHMKANGETLKSFTVEIRHGYAYLIRTRDHAAWLFDPATGRLDKSNHGNAHHS